jgi:hypothetical protein
MSIRKVYQLEKLKRALYAAVGSGEPEAQALRRGCRADYRVNRARLKAAWDVFQREWTRRYGGGPCHDDNEDRWRWLVTVAAMEVLAHGHRERQETKAHANVEPRTLNFEPSHASHC